MRLLCLHLMLFSISGCKVDMEPVPNDGASSTKPEEIYPFWNQSWKSGTWRPLTYEPRPESYIYCKPDPRRCPIPAESTGTFYYSRCQSSGNIRIIDKDRKMERIILSGREEISIIKPEWKPAISNGPLAPIRKGDALFMICKNEMYVVLIKTISPDQEDTMTYGFAAIPKDEGLPTEVNMNKLQWRMQTGTKEIRFADRTLRFYTGHSLPRKGFSQIEVSISYDNYFGWYTGAPLEYPWETPLAHIAVVDREYLEQNNLVDLTKFRFKTWEDGMGNRGN